MQNKRLKWTVWSSILLSLIFTIIGLSILIRYELGSLDKPMIMLYLVISFYSLHFIMGLIEIFLIKLPMNTKRIIFFIFGLLLPPVLICFDIWLLLLPPTEFVKKLSKNNVKL
ncbi:hypothetical protein [Metamycoplasma neophronis]|uniref:DUF3817 domain-containing protein n=1 Tax=Metamycoplasma neophronis TaxID=872983 RepID=A0ABY2Z2K4_9BACT|nr:hypothetical protein [Metamycoplasma neophronis]TPR54346.1 hypothetical protein FJR74_01050 [Metamycoplasma neophronis]